ncbi:8-oxoguanine DNA glycosylase OGG fold protein [Mycobacterium sp. BMJ-28]
MAATDLADIHLPASAVIELQATDPTRWIHGHGFPVNRQWWTVELTKHGLDDTILGDSISRSDLFNIAQPALDDPAAALTLLWNSLAWGSGDSQRNNKARIASIAADPDSAAALLQEAARLSRTDPRAAYDLLRPKNKTAISDLGPAFFTKYLYFAGGGRGDHRSCILDRNVAASLNRTCSWATLPIEGAWLASAYERYALLLDRWVDEHHLSRHDVVERWLFEDGKTIKR